MLKCLFREPFKGQASVRALDEGDATGEHVSTDRPRTHPTCQDREVLPGAGVALTPSQPLPTGLPSPSSFPWLSGTLRHFPSAEKSRWEVSTEK